MIVVQGNLNNNFYIFIVKKGINTKRYLIFSYNCINLNFHRVCVYNIANIDRIFYNAPRIINILKNFVLLSFPG